MTILSPGSIRHPTSYYHESGVGHIEGNLSALDLMVMLHHEALQPSDQFVLSKGHSVGVLYVTLWKLGRLTDDDLKSFHKDGTKLSGHPPTHEIEEILFATGSLGHGFPLAAGLALGKQIKGEPGRVYCLMSDGEWDEGSNWEVLSFARHHGLRNLRLIVDLNDLQGFGPTAEVADLHPLAAKFREFRLITREIDGHDPAAIPEALLSSAPGPDVIVARTRKGYGVSFMEHRMEWHYLPLNAAQYEQALASTGRRSFTAKNAASTPIPSSTS
jgi:transketolase